MKEDGDLLRGIVEADETYLGGKTRGDDRVMGRSRKRKVGIGCRGARRYGQGFTLASHHRQVHQHVPTQEYRPTVNSHDRPMARLQ